MLPAALIQALEDEQGRPFMSRENLLRYGVIYPEAGLPAPNNPWGWPIGFVVDDIAALGGPQFSLTCAACHTGEIRRQGRRAIIEGGQATMDIVRMGGDWSAAFLATDADPSRRTRFLARAVALGHAPDRVEADFARIIEGIRAHAREQARRADTVAGPMR
jgi:hypothetical protein